MSSTITNSGIRKTDDGASYIPASRRADGSTRKEIRVRPGFTPQEDVKTYKSRTAEAWKSRGSGGVPGAEDDNSSRDTAENKSKNAKRREAAKKRQTNESTSGVESETNDGLVIAMDRIDISGEDQSKASLKEPRQLAQDSALESQAEIDKQKKIRNQLKKLKAVRELKDKKSAGEKLSHDQLMKIGKEEELIRDLNKLGYCEQGGDPQSIPGTGG